MNSGINGVISDQEMDKLLANLLQIENDPWTIKSHLANSGAILIMSDKIPSRETQKYSVVTCRGDGCPKELSVIFDLVQNVAKREGNPYSQQTPTSCSIE